MHCPFCSTDDTKVTDSRLVSDGSQVRRRRECAQCGERFTTYEVATLTMPRVIKRDGERVPFDEDKIRRGILRALEKRPVEMDTAEGVISRIMHKLYASGEREVASQKIGEYVMQALKELDKVAFVRFASVYRNFEDVDAFHQEIQKLQQEPKGTPHDA